jgi:hypothetical protein
MNEKGSANQILITLKATKGIEWIYSHEGGDKMNHIRVTREQFPRSGACVEVRPASCSQQEVMVIATSTVRKRSLWATTASDDTPPQFTWNYPVFYFSVSFSLMVAFITVRDTVIGFYSV